MTLRGCLYAAGRAAGAPPTRCVGCGMGCGRIILAEAGPQAQIGCVPQSAYLSPEMGDHAEKAELLVSRYLTSQCTGGSSGKDEYGAKQRSCVMSTCGTLRKACAILIIAVQCRMMLQHAEGSCVVSSR